MTRLLEPLPREIYEHTTVEDYNPTPAELYFWYSGTHAGLDPNNPYAPRHSMRVAKTTMKKLSAQSQPKEK